MAAAAVRIPDPRILALPRAYVANGPQIFVHEGARQALERRLSAAFPGPIQLLITDNRRRMVTYRNDGGTLRVRLHMMFLDAPDAVVDALVAYIREDARDASQRLGEYIHQNGHRIRAVRPVTGPLHTRGKVHDLVSILGQVNATYFDSSLDVLITWGRRVPLRSEKRVSIKLGSYSATERLVRVHPVLDREWVPRYFVSAIVYHELLHHLIPPALVRGRMVMHSEEFLRREAEFRHHDRALEWERKNLNRLLRAR